MEYRLLGRSGLKVSTLSIGTATFGGDGLWGDTDLADARRQIALCLDAGINLIDTANVYSKSVSETIIGEALSGGLRDKLLLATKVRFSTGPGPNDRGLSRYHIIRECEQSLKRLKTDVIDLYQVHEWDGETPLEETVEALDTLIKQGKVRYVGCSNYSAWHLMKALAIADARLQERFISQQIHYTLHSREAEYELLPLGLDQGVGTLVWSPMAGGLLTGKYRRDAKPEDGRHVRGFHEPPIPDWNRLYDIVDVIVAIAAERGISGAQVSLAWLLDRPGVVSAIIGGRNLEQFKDSLKAADLKLTSDETARLDRVSRPPLLYPYWHQSYTATDRMGAPDLVLHRHYPERPGG